MFTKIHEERVEKLAQAVEKSKTYNQCVINNCGSPGCLMGHAEVVFKRSKAKIGLNWRQFLFGLDPENNLEALSVFTRDAFSSTGCDNAGRNGKKAARFIRKMARDLKAAYAKAKAA